MTDQTRVALEAAIIAGGGVPTDPQDMNRAAQTIVVFLRTLMQLYLEAGDRAFLHGLLGDLADSVERCRDG